MKIFVLFVFVTLPLSALSTLNQSCAHSKGAEPDLTVHGRLAVYNGGYPNFRLWHIGTHHLFGIYSSAGDRIGIGDRKEDGPALPKELDRLYEGENAFNIEVYGDYVVRPLRKYHEGVQQPACIISAEHLARKVR